jgi:hypothetical protein
MFALIFIPHLAYYLLIPNRDVLVCFPAQYNYTIELCFSPYLAEQYQHFTLEKIVQSLNRNKA